MSFHDTLQRSSWYSIQYKFKCQKWANIGNFEPILPHFLLFLSLNLNMIFIVKGENELPILHFKSTHELTKFMVPYMDNHDFEIRNYLM